LTAVNGMGLNSLTLARGQVSQLSVKKLTLIS
jgi:hypothetical protein